MLRGCYAGVTQCFTLVNLCRYIARLRGAGHVALSALHHGLSRSQNASNYRPEKPKRLAFGLPGHDSLTRPRERLDPAPRRHDQQFCSERTKCSAHLSSLEHTSKHSLAGIRPTLHVDGAPFDGGRLCERSASFRTGCRAQRVARARAYAGKRDRQCHLLISGTHAIAQVNRKTPWCTSNAC